MGSFSFAHWLVVLAIVLILFGGGNKLSRMMGDVGKGIKEWRTAVRDDDTPATDHHEGLLK